MEQTFPAFVDYMEKERHSSASTVMSYQRDVRRMITFLGNKGISDVKDVTGTSLNSYMLYLEELGFTTADGIQKCCFHESLFSLCLWKAHCGDRSHAEHQGTSY